MKIQEFADKYYPEVTKEVKNINSLFTTDGFPYDEVIVDDEGVKIPVLNTSAYQIPLTDVFGLSRDEFIKIYQNEECVEVYDRYLSAYTILEGFDTLTYIQNIVRSLVHQNSVRDDSVEFKEYI